MVFAKTDPDIIRSLQQQLAYSADITCKEIESPAGKAQLLYIQSICDEGAIHDLVYTPFFESGSAEEFIRYLDCHPNAQFYLDDAHALHQMTQGGVVLVLDTRAFLIGAKKTVGENVLEAKIESTIQGPQNALSENLAANISILRLRYRNPAFTVEMTEIGSLSHTQVALIYDRQLVDEIVLKEVKRSLSGISLDVIQSTGQLERQMSQQKRSLFPTMIVTERPDRVVFNLPKGKIILVVDGSPFALIIPSVFYDFMSSMDDMYQSYWVGRFLVILRYIGLAICLTLPALYVAVTAYNPEIFRVQLALSVAGSREGVPYPAFIEVLFMLLMMELLTEASIRLPKSIGSTATTVGGLILGQAATAAGLVSDIMIIIVAAVAIANFVIPINEMGFAMRIVKYINLALATLFGLTGLIVGIIGLLAYLANMESFGRPYLKLFINQRK